MCCCGKECVKCFLYFFDVIFFLTGIGLLVTGIYMFLGFLVGTYSVFLSGVPYLYVAYILIGVGLFIILISIIGCIAAAKDSGCWLLTFYFLIVLVICVEVSIIIIAFAGLHLKDDVHTYIQKSTQNEMKYFNHHEHKEFTEAWDTLQQDQLCCGFKLPNDWFEHASNTFDVGETPDSCCKLLQVGCGRTGDYRFKEGCGDIMMDTVNHGLKVIGSVCVGFVFLQVILIIYILILYYLIRFGVKQRCCSASVYDDED